MTLQIKTAKKQPLVSNSVALNIAYNLNEQLQKMNLRNLDIAKNQYANAIFYKTIKTEGVFYFNAVIDENKNFDIKLPFKSTIKNWGHYCQEELGQPAEVIDLEIASIEKYSLQIKELFNVTHAYEAIKECRLNNNLFIQLLAKDGYPLILSIGE